MIQAACNFPAGWHWVVQQLREAWSYKQSHRFLLFDCDTKLGADVVSTVRDMGSEPTRTAFRSPWQNGVAERWVGSCRRDLLEPTVVPPVVGVAPLLSWGQWAPWSLLTCEARRI